MKVFLETLLPYVFYMLGIVLGVTLLYAVKTYLLPWLKTKLDANTYALLETKIRTLIASAENKENKQQWVIDQIKLLNISINEDYARNLIDGLVRVMTKEGIINTKEGSGSKLNT